MSIERLIECIAGSGEVVATLVGFVQVADRADGFPEVVDGPGTDPTKIGLQLGERHLDGVEIGAVRRQEEELERDDMALNRWWDSH